MDKENFNKQTSTTMGETDNMLMEQFVFKVSQIRKLYKSRVKSLKKLI